MREIREELGFDVVPERLLAVDWVPPRDGRTDGLMLVFDGGLLTGAETARIRLPAYELLSWAWCTEAEADERLAGRLARRVRAATRSRYAGVTAYLEDGF